MRVTRGLCPLLLLFSAVAASTCSAEEDKVLFDLHDPATQTALRALFTTEFQAGSAQLILDGSRKQDLVLPLEKLKIPGDWRGWEYLEIDAENSSAHPLTQTVLLRTVENSFKDFECAGFSAVLPAGKRVKWKIPLRHLPYTFSGWEWNYLPGDVPALLNCWNRLPLNEVRQLVFCQYEQRGSFALYGLRLTDPFSAAGWVNEFGQRKDLAFPRAVHSADDIRQRDAEELKALAGAPNFPDRDEYQAWAAGPQCEATGFFRVQKIDERWWLVAPNGHLFFATGICCVSPEAHAPITELTRPAYSWLPSQQDEFSFAWSKQGLSFYQINLYRKWGAAWRAQFLERTSRRLAAWGFTSIGNWAAEEFCVPKKLPYVTAGPGLWFDWAALEKCGLTKLPMVTTKIIDVFHPDFEKEAFAYTAASIGRFKDDPWCIGHFTYNELDWPKWAQSIFELPAGQPAKVWLIAELKKRYAGIDALNAAWGTHATSFESLRWPFGDKTPTVSAAAADIRALREQYAERWYQVWSAAVRAACPHHLVLGSRINQGDSLPEIIRACAKYADVVSFNHYEAGPRREMFDRIYKLAGKPLFIGEYGHNSRDEGLLTTAVPVKDQAARGQGFSFYTEQLASIPYFVGCNYFQYIDEPITGRFDSETAYNGFVNVADIPCEPLVKAAQITHARIYELHAAKSKPTETPPEP